MYSLGPTFTFIAPEYSSSPPPYSSSASSPFDFNIDYFRSLITRHQISPFFAHKIRQLRGYDIVLLCDDSGSMATELCSSSLPVDPFGARQTRWCELKSTVSVLVDFATLLDDNGADIYFLNREGVSNCTNKDQVSASFAAPPEGGTPIVQRLRSILRKYQTNGMEKKVWICIATDGQPTNDQGKDDIPELKRVLEKERMADKVHVTFLACTDEQSTMDYLNGWDIEMKNVDVVDDYESEKKEILKVQGDQFVFSKGDYVAKILIGSIDPYVDMLDEKKMILKDDGTAQFVEKKSSCCIQ